MSHNAMSENLYDPYDNAKLVIILFVRNFVM